MKILEIDDEKYETVAVYSLLKTKAFLDSSWDRDSTMGHA